MDRFSGLLLLERPLILGLKLLDEMGQTSRVIRIKAILGTKIQIESQPFQEMMLLLCWDMLCIQGYPKLGLNMCRNGFH
ncbi:hypothetical protein [Desulfovermiculus halophilus]|uniref:hypothetical protein n=1 Tax=Desulfovermiculus halophilus TaxID=339722 RepID=UPI001ABF91D3|nr:hypothetical protein [Desulfovermiculus halophilus]